MFTLDQSHVDDTWTPIQCMQYVLKWKMREKDHPVSLGLVLGQTTDRLPSGIEEFIEDTRFKYECRF